MATADIAEGIDEIMYQVRGGKSLSEVIAETTNQRYTDLDDFETRFAQDGAAFSKELLDLSQNGFGALVGGNYTSNDILANNTITNQQLFTLYPDHDVVYNEYKEGYNFLEGGLAEAKGIAGAGHPNYSATHGGNQGGTTLGGGNPTGEMVQPIIIEGSSSKAMVKDKRISLQIGGEAGHQMDIFIEAINTSMLGLYHVDLRTAKGATEAIDIIGNALTKVSEQRTELGAYQNRLEHTIQNLENVVENTTASESQIRDSDMTKLMMEYSNNQILLQAGQVMLAQANRRRESVLGLLQM